MRIRGNKLLWDRQKIEKHTKYKQTEEIANHLSKTKKEVLYQYYVCDYCGDEIIIKNKWEEKTGGIVNLPASLTGGYPLTLTLCNKCLNAVQQEFSKQMISDNQNHIPRID